VSTPSGQELVDPFGWMVRETREDIREPRLRIDVAVSMSALGAALARFRTRSWCRDQRWTFQHCNVRQLDTESFVGRGRPRQPRASKIALSSSNRAYELF
jgi:hypothetical protein